MRNVIKNKIKILTALLVAFVLSMTMFGFTLFVGERAGAVSKGAELVSAIEAAPADYLTTTRIVIGTEGEDSAEDNGQVITIESTDTDTESVTVPSGTRIVFSAVAPSAKKELEGNAIYSRIIFNVPLIVEAEAEVVFDVDVEFNAAVTVNGTMELGGIARNRGAFTVSNEEDSHADIQSRGLIVSGSFNNDAAQGGSLTALSGASIVIEAPTTYTANSQDYSNNDGGALLLKAKDGSLGLTLEDGAQFENGGSVIYESGATLPDSVTGTAAAFSTSTSSSSVTVFYDGNFSRELPSGFATSLDGKTLLSFGRTTLKPSSGYNFSVSGTASLGGGKTGSGAVFTQGANVLTLDGGAKWTEGKHSIPGEWWEPDFHSLYFLVGESADARTEYKNNGQSRSSALVSVSSNGTLDLYGGAEIVRSEVQKGETSGGGVKVTDGALNLYGGKIAYNAVTKSTNNGTGGGVFLNEGSTCTIYGGKITRNALANYDQRSADGAGIAVNGGGVIIYGGEISYNCGAQGGSDAGADGGGVIAREGANVAMYGGSISCNWTGGFGGGVLLWQSSFTMDGGEMQGNYAAFGGAVGMTSGSEGSPSSFTMNGGTLSGNTAFYNTNTRVGGYGGGVCVGANLSSGDNYKYHSSATITGGEVSGNRAVYGGGMAIYTKEYSEGRDVTKIPSYLKMSGGTITGNTAYSDSTFSTVKHENGDGVYVYCESEGYTNSNGGILRMSGAASIDSSNNVSFSFGSGGANTGSTAPIQVTGELTGDRLAALVRIQSESSWSGKNIVSYANRDWVNRDKFLLDSTSYSFVNATSASALQISNSTADNAVAQVNDGATYTTLAAAVAAASSRDTIRILKTATLTEPVTINKNLTILAYGADGADGDYTLGVASDFSYGSVNNPALFLVENGATLTLGGSQSGTLTVDGNSSSSLGISLISVRSGGTYVQKSDVTLSNNKSNDAGGAIYNSGGTVTIEGGTIRGTTGAGGAIYNSGGTVNLKGGTIKDNKDTSGLSYGVYQTGETSILNLNGELALSDKIYTAGVVNVNSGFTNTGGKIGVTFPAMWNAATVVVNVSKDYINGNSGAASGLLDVFEVYNMDEDYRLVVRDTNSVEANALVVGKSVTYVFYFDYQSGFEKEDVFTNGISFSDVGVQTILKSLEQYGNSAFESKIKTRQNAVVVEMDSGSSFDLSSMSSSGYVSMTGYTLIRWQVGSAAQDIAYNGTLAYQDSSAEIPVRSVWVANTYEISFDSNYNSIEGANADTVEGKVFSQKIEYSDVETTAGGTKKLNANNFVAVGWVFTGWKTSGNDSVYVYGNEADITDEVLLELAKGVKYNYTLTDGKVTGAVYPITLRAQWQSIFGEGSGAGTAQAPFVIKDAADLAMLEATVNGDSPVETPGGHPYYNGHDGSGHDGSGALSYTAESYEGYTFSLAGDIDSFGGVIGRVSAEGELAAHLNQEAELASTVYADIPSGQVAGTPFKGTFNGNGNSIGLAISRTIESGGSAGNALVGVGLFGYTDHAVIRDLTLTGSVVGYAHVGGLIGYAYGGTISRITNAADVSSGGHDVGGIIGTFFEDSSNYTASSVSDVVNTGSVSYVPVTNDKTNKVDIEDEWNELGTISDAVGIRYGGVVGSGVTLRLTGGYNTGAVTARYVVGGVAGSLRSLIDTTVDGAFITQSFNTGKITATAGLYASVTYKEYTVPFITAYTGGVVGRIVGAGYVNYSFNSGSVTGTFVGKVDGDPLLSGSVTKAEAPAVGSDDSGNYLGARGVGGIVGFTSYDLTSGAGGSKSISYVYNTGSVSAWSSVGGIAGYLAHSTIDYAFNGGNVTATGTHYDTASASRVAGGYNNAVAYLGAIVGRGVVATINSTVYYNTDSTYTGYTDNTVQAVGDTYYNAQLGTETNYSSALGLTSNQMSVPSENTRPGGFSANFQTTGWAYKYYEGYYYYPQLVVFAENAKKVGGTPVSDISKESAEITYKNEEGVDTPVLPTDTFKVSFVLGGGYFPFVGEDDNGSYFEEDGMRYTDSGDRWSYSVVFSSMLEQPEDPARVGYTFDGWYADPTFTKPFSFDSVPGSNVTVYAKWQVITYNIIYDNVSSVGGSIGGDYVSSFSSETTTRQYFPTDRDLSRRGYTLDHWVYYDSASGEEHPVESFYVAGEQLYLFGASEDAPVCTLSLSALPSSGLSLRADWKATEYTVSYYDDDDEQILDFSDTYTIEQSRDLAAGPAKTGYTFKGWKIKSYDSADAVNNSLYNAYSTSGTALSQIYPNTVGDFALEAIYDVNSHTLYFNANGGTIEDYESKGLFIDTTGRYYAELEYGTSLARFNGLIPVAPEGKTFDGWYLNLNFEGNAVNLSTYTLPDSDITLYAKYDTATFVVTVEYNGDAVKSVDEHALSAAGFTKGDNETWLLNGVEFGSDISGKLSDFVKALTLKSGWNFSGWSVSENSSIYNVRGEMTVTADYKQGEVTVNFVGFDKTTLQAVTITVNSSVEEESVPTPSEVIGYTFKGWVNAAGQTVNPTAESFAVSTTLYANYEPVSVTALFYLAKDTDNQLQVTYNMTYSYGSAFGSFPSYAKLFAELEEGQKGEWRGYRIVGWYTDEALSDLDLVTAASLADISNGVTGNNESGFTVSLYAKLEYETYTINFIANGGSFAGGAGTASGSYTYGAVAPFPSELTHTGHDFAGWSYNNAAIEREGDETYEEALLGMIKAAGVTGTINIVAEWEKKTFEVWYSAEEGSFTVTENSGGVFYAADGSSQVTQAGESAKYFVVEVDYGTTPSVSLRPSRYGYAFSSYLDSSDSAVTAVTSEKYTKDSPICARYSIVTYTVTYITNGAASIQNGTYTVENHISLPVPSYTGYDFGGWFTSSAFDGVALTSTSGLAQDLILYAKWTPKDVSFTLQITLPSEANVGDFKTALEGKLKLTGFDGLLVSAVGTLVTATFTAKYGENVSSLNTLLSDIPVDGAIAGVWQKNDTSYIFTTVTDGGTYTNGYDPATGTTHTVTFKLDENGETYLVVPVLNGNTVSSVLNVTEPSRTGYTFAGWKTGTDDFALDSPINQDTIVWAEWTANKYKVTFNANGGSVTPTSIEVTFGASYGEFGASYRDLPEPSRIGYTFAGWYLGDVPVTKDTPVSTASDHELTAKWTAVDYRINFHFGESRTETFEAAYGTTIDYPDASRTYYTLSGWQVVRKDGGSETLKFSYETMPDLNSEEFDAFRTETESEGVVSIEVYAVYTPITYSTTFEDHDGTSLGNFEVTVESTVESGGDDLRAESPSRTGYTFLGWSVYYEHLHDEAYFTFFTIEDGTGENAGHMVIKLSIKGGAQGSVEIDIERLGEIRFVALYEANKYTVTFEANGVTGTMTAQSFTYDKAQPLTQNTFSRTGYTFAGWNTQADGNGTAYSDGQTVSNLTAEANGSVTLYAVWTPNTYTVIFVSNGGEGEMTAQSFTYGERKALSVNLFERTGYAFAGWSTGTQTYDDEEEVSNLTDRKDGYVLLTAQWTANTYEVTFNANGGTVSPESTMVTFGGTYPKLPVPTREGYTFIGWFTAAAGGTQVTATTTVSTAKDHTLYAQWSVNGVVVTFDYAGADGNNATLSTTVQFGSPYGNLPEPTRTGYTFDGWFTAKEGGSMVTSKTPLENSAPHTLYAHWTASTFTVTFDAGEGVVSPDKITVTFGASYKELPELTRTGYTFVGWFTQGGALVTEESIVTATGDHTLYAVWTADTFTVTFDANGGAVSPDEITVTFGGTYPKLPIPTRDGYTFVGWYNDEKVFVESGDEVEITADIKLTAKWTAIGYSITYNLGGGTADNPLNYNIETETFTLKAPTRTGYTFAGWTGTGLSAATKTVTIEKGSMGDRAYTATWKAIKYKVTFDANYEGGTVSPESTMVTFGASYDALPELTRTGYTFAGWYLGDALVTAQTIVNTAEDHMLTAQWTANTYLVIFNPNGGTGTMTAQSFTYGKTQALSENVFERTGYGFAGWNTEADGKGTSYSDGQTVSDLISQAGGSVTLYAVWKADVYTINYILGGGANAESNPSSYTVESGQIIFAAPSRVGYAFVGWFDAETDGKKIESLVAGSTGNVTLYARWAIEEFTVTFMDGGETKAEQTVAYGGKATSVSAEKKGYTFLGWFDGEKEYDFASAVTKDMTLTAKWEIVEYTITYNLGGGTNAAGNPANYTVESGQIIFAAPSRTGYTFVGWFDAETEGTQITEIAAGNTGNVTLYARWAIEEFTVTFKDGDETKDMQTVAYGGKATSVSAEKRGYTFLGWFDGEKEYDFASAVTKDMTLTAKWEIVEYTITYNLGGGTNAESNPSSYTVESGQITFAAPSRTGYSFVGWFDAEEGGKKIESLVAGSTGNVTLYARWSIEEFTVTFMDGDETKAEQTVAYGGKATSVSAEKRGYTFLGWFDGEKEYDFASAVTKDMTLTAKWEIVEYTITYNLGGGTNAESNPANYTVESGQITFAAPSRVGYAFVGWFDAEEGGNEIESLAAGSTGNVTLYARWSIESYTVKFETNGGETIADKTVEHGSILARPDAVREGYLFVGWYADAALTQAYDFDEAVTKDMTLYAKWRTTVLSATAENGVQVIVTSSDGFDDGVHVVIEVRSSDTELLQGALSKGVQMLIAYDISLRDANGDAVQAGKTYAVTLSLKGLGQPKGEYGIVYIPDDYDAEGVQKLAVSIVGEEISFFAEHFSVYAIVDITPTAGIGPWVWILVAIAAAAMAAAVILIILRGRNRFELRYVNAGIPSVKLKESALIEMPVPEREDAVFEGWYYDEAFENRAIISAMPKENVVLYAKWRLMTEEERAAREAKRREEQEGKREIHPDEM